MNHAMDNRCGPIQAGGRRLGVGAPRGVTRGLNDSIVLSIIIVLNIIINVLNIPNVVNVVLLRDCRVTSVLSIRGIFVLV